MKDDLKVHPKGFKEILEETNKVEFNQLSDARAGSLLATLAASKPNASFLELGTGSGLSTAWILQGMDENSSLVSVDEDKQLVDIANKFLGFDKRVSFITGKGEDVILSAALNSVDFIFADTWPGKYNHLEETLSLLKVGGLYIIDDMLEQENWPEGHGIKAKKLICYLESRDDLIITKMNWSTGLIICTRKY